MLIKHDRMLRNGHKLVIIELDPGETLVPVHKDSYYQLGYPVEDVVPAEVMQGAKRVTWCSIEQRWIA